MVLNFNCVNSVYKTHYINNWRGVRVKEREIPGLIELKMEFESKLAGMKEYQELKSEFDRSAMGLIKEAIRSKGIRLESGRTPGSQPSLAVGCGFCEVCITACTDCVAWS